MKDSTRLYAVAILSVAFVAGVIQLASKLAKAKAQEAKDQKVKVYTNMVFTTPGALYFDRFVYAMWKIDTNGVLTLGYIDEKRKEFVPMVLPTAPKEGK